MGCLARIVWAMARGSAGAATSCVHSWEDTGDASVSSGCTCCVWAAMVALLFCNEDHKEAAGSQHPPQRNNGKP